MNTGSFGLLLRPLFLLVVLISALTGSGATAQTLEVTATGPTTFTIKVGEVYSWRVEEKIGTVWSTLTSGPYGDSSYDYTRAAGTYTFRLQNCYPLTYGCSTSTLKS